MSAPAPSSASVERPPVPTGSASRLERARPRVDLGPAGPIDRLERAFLATRSLSLSMLAMSWWAASLPALAWLFAFYLDVVEGWSALRPLSALVLVLAYFVRTTLVVEPARELVRAVAPDLAIDEQAGRPLAVLRTAAPFALGLIFWSTFLGVAAWGGLVGVLGAGWLTALRGAWAPGWIARVAVVDRGGLGAFREALRDGDGQRGEGVAVESLLHVAYLVMFVNFALAGAAVLMLARSFMGIEVGLVDEFVSLRNGFVVLALCLAVLVAFEPVRLGVAAVAFADAAMRRDGLGLRIAIDRSIELAPKRRVVVAATLVLGLVLPVLSLHAPVLAEPPASPMITAAPNAEVPSAETPEVAEARRVATDTSVEVDRTAEAILAGRDYADFGGSRDATFREALDQFFEYLFRLDPDLPDSAAGVGGPTIGLPRGEVFVVLGAIAVVVVLGWLLMSRRPAVPASEPPADATPKVADPRERAAEDWLADAVALRAAGRFTEALRAVYLATLVALDRRRVIEYEPTRTNWQYLRSMKADGAEGQALRRAFASLTRRFDAKWYGGEDTSASEVDDSISLARSLVAPPTSS